MVEQDGVSPLARRHLSGTHKDAAPDQLPAIIVYPASESSKKLEPEKCENACDARELFPRSRHGLQMLL